MRDPKRIVVYQASDGGQPFEDWLTQLKDKKAQARIRVRINRLRAGLLGDVKSIGQSIHELRIDIGKGYRVYFGNHGDTLVVLLCGSSDKKSQDKEIKQAKRYWDDYKSRTKSESIENSGGV